MKDPQHLLQFVHIATSLGSLCLGNKCCFCCFFSVFRNLQFASVCPTCKVPSPHVSFIPDTWHVSHLSWRFFSTPTQRAPRFQHLGCISAKAKKAKEGEKVLLGATFAFPSHLAPAFYSSLVTSKKTDSENPRFFGCPDLAFVAISAVVGHGPWDCYFGNPRTLVS